MKKQLVSQPRKAKFNSKLDHQIQQNRKKLAQIWLRHESQNTKLLKIQQKQRNVDKLFQQKQKKNAQTIKRLTQQEQLFEKQKQMALREFEQQKQFILSNDKKRTTLQTKKKQLQISNKMKIAAIANLQDEVNKKKAQQAQLRKTIENFKIYQDFLKRVLILQDQVTSESQDQNVQPIIDRYKKLIEQNQRYKDERLEIQKKKGDYAKELARQNALHQDKLLSSTSQLNQLKAKIQRLTQQNIAMENEIQKKISQNNNRMVDYYQIINCIKNLYSLVRDFYSPNNPGLGDQPDTTKSLMDKLYFIKDYSRTYFTKIDQKNRKK